MHTGMGGPDNGWMHDHLTELSQAISALANDLGANIANVTLVTLTEFGRRMQENGSGGTDHGFGQVMLMLGGGVEGGVVHGTWPGLSESALIDGDLNGVNDYRVVLAEILEKRCGAGSVSSIFPGTSQSRLGVVRPR
jgi:uncharacterized protein (DUF1501 family)